MRRILSGIFGCVGADGGSQIALEAEEGK